MKFQKDKIINFFKRNIRKITMLFVLFIHIIVIFFFVIKVETSNKENRVNELFKMVDVEVYIPPPPPPAPPEEKKEEKNEKKEEETILVSRQEVIVESVIETKKEVQETEIEFLPQHKISDIPILPTNEIKERIIYPLGAKNQGIEGIVILELFIDQDGNIKHLEVLKDPGYGFAEAAKEALKGIKCLPAKANGIPVAVKFRYPIRFTLK